MSARFGEGVLTGVVSLSSYGFLIIVTHRAALVEGLLTAFYLFI